MAAANADRWVRTEHRLPNLLMVGFYPLWALALSATLISGPRGKPGTPERRNFERLNDELTIAHAGVAYRWGFFAALGGLGGVTATAVLAPKGVLFAVIAACWLAAMTTVIRFGLLQRAAEGVD